MKISFENDAPTQVSYESAQCWRVIWNSGTTEGGSSGSPLFNQDHRIVGQLYGGNASCSNTSGHDNYGRFNISWNRGLSDFLDPNNTGAMTTNTIAIPYISGPTHVCYTSSKTFTLVNMPAGATVNWTKSNNLSYIGGQGTLNYTVKASSSIVSGEGWVQANISTTQ